ncbi:MAG TPA: ABC transporter permease [Bacillota bacterium]|nr:ABC transporter permease [Bacillota bacterium]
MHTLLARRLASMVPIVLGVTIAVFAVLHLAPGCPTTIMLGDHASPEAIEELRNKLGLDDPLYVQYFRWLSGVARGDFGRSIHTRQLVLEMVLQRVPATMELTFAAMILSLVIAVPVGVISATKQYSVVDHATMAGALFGVSMPVFWQGLMGMLVFGFLLGWLPISGRGGLEHLILPAITLGTSQAGLIARLTRSSMLEVIRQDYITTARSKGLAERVVIAKHALKNALIPVVTILALQLPALFGGAVITETVFAWPGMGRLIVTSIFVRDFPVVQAVTLIMAMVVILCNLLADVSYIFLDPRIRYDS